MNSEVNFKRVEHEQSNAVVSFDNGTTFKIAQLMKQVNNFFQQLVINGLSDKLNQIGLGSTPSRNCYFNTGVNAEILEPRSGKWKTGKIRMRVVLEFCPNEPEAVENDASQQNGNSLDDIRQTIT